MTTEIGPDHSRAAQTDRGPRSPSQGSWPRDFSAVNETAKTSLGVTAASPVITLNPIMIPHFTTCSGPEINISRELSATYGLARRLSRDSAQPKPLRAVQSSLPWGTQQPRRTQGSDPREAVGGQHRSSWNGGPEPQPFQACEPQRPLPPPRQSAVAPYRGARGLAGATHMSRGWGVAPDTPFLLFPWAPLREAGRQDPGLCAPWEQCTPHLVKAGRPDPISWEACRGERAKWRQIRDRFC